MGGTQSLARRLVPITLSSARVGVQVGVQWPLIWVLPGRQLERR